MKSIFRKFRFAAAFAKAPELKDATPSAVEASPVSATPTGDWVTLTLVDSKQAVRVDLGELAARHNNGEEILTNKRPVKEGEVIELRPDLKVGVVKGVLTFN